MILITKDSLPTFNEYYHNFHDSYITNINYDFKHSQIELFIDVYWTGKPILKQNGVLENNKTKMKIVCNGIMQYNFKEVFSDYIDTAIVKYINIGNKKYICFASDEIEPLVYIICDNIEYEELKIANDFS